MVQADSPYQYLTVDVNDTLFTATIVSGSNVPAGGALVVPTTVDVGGTTYTVVAIGDNAFNGNTVITSLSFEGGSSVTSIGVSAFYACTNLTNVIFPANLESIDTSAFQSCIHLTSITFPESPLILKLFAFGYCSELDSVRFAGGYPDGANYDTWAFRFSGVQWGNDSFPDKGIPTFTTTDLLSWTDIPNGASNGAKHFIGQTLTEPTVPCFAEGTRILTQHGYKAIETLDAEDRIVTSDLRIVPFNLFKTATLQTTTKKTAPYLIQRHAFGHNLPAAPIQLSPDHKIQIGAGRWLSAKMAARNNPRITQCDVGAPVTYYQIECENYFKDNLIAEGLTVESYGTIKATGGKKDIYTWNEELAALTRPADIEKKAAPKSA